MVRAEQPAAEPRQVVGADYRLDAHPATSRYVIKMSTMSSVSVAGVDLTVAEETGSRRGVVVGPSPDVRESRHSTVLAVIMCLSVCVSQVGVVQRRLNLGSH